MRAAPFRTLPLCIRACPELDSGDLHPPELSEAISRPEGVKTHNNSQHIKYKMINMPQLQTTREIKRILLRLQSSWVLFKRQPHRDKLINK